MLRQNHHPGSRRGISQTGSSGFETQFRRTQLCNGTLQWNYCRKVRADFLLCYQSKTGLTKNTEDLLIKHLGNNKRYDIGKIFCIEGTNGLVL